MRMVLSANPHIFNHNLETVRRLTPSVRSRATYDRSLSVLGKVKSRRGDTIHTKSGLMLGLGETEEELFTAMRDLYAGITYINAPTIGAEVHLPFGGVKATGNGHREGGVGAIDFYSEWKAVYVDYSDKLQRAQIDRPE